MFIRLRCWSRRVIGIGMESRMMLYEVFGIHKASGQKFLIPGPSFDNVFKAAKTMKAYQERMGPGYKFVIAPID